MDTIYAIKQGNTLYNIRDKSVGDWARTDVAPNFNAIWTSNIEDTSSGGYLTVSLKDVNVIEGKVIQVNDLILYSNGKVGVVVDVLNDQITSKQTTVNLKSKDGVGIYSVEINEDSELILTYTDNTTTNLGSLSALLADSIPTKVSQLENDEEYITLDDVPNEVVVSETDENPDVLPDGATVQFIIEPDETEDELMQQLFDYIDTQLNNKTPTKVSQLENDENYITQENLDSTLDNKKYVDESYVTEAINTAFANIRRAEEGEY